MKKALPALLALSLALVLLAACGGGEAPASEAPPETSAPESEAPERTEPEAPENEPVTLLVAAAASLENTCVTRLIPLFQDQYPWITVEGSYDSSGKLQTQIEEGLEASVFMSAAQKQMNALVDAGFIDGASVVDLLENELVLIAPADSATPIASFEEIADAETIAVGDPESVPAGQYAREALTSLGVWDAIQPKASLGTSVTEVLNAVAEGSADVGIVYATDAAQKPDQVKILATAPKGSLEAPVIYPVGILTAAPQPEAAALFVEFLQSPEAMDILAAAGFKPNI